MDARDPSSALFSLDDVVESVERENLDIRFSTMMNALNQANGALHEIIIPSSQNLVARSWNKSRFLCERKAEWDRLTEEARLRGDVSAQLAIVQWWEAEACRDVEEFHAMFEDLPARMKLDGEEIARLRKERDKLLQKSAAANERAGELLVELETERDLKLKALERSTALRQRADRAIRERDEARGVADSLRADLGDAVSRRLDVENVVTRLKKELAKVREILWVESDEHDLLQTIVGVVTDALEVVQPEGSSSLAARAAGIMARVGQLEEDAFHAGITQAFAIAHSHYDQEINLKVMSHGFAPIYDDDELDKMEKEVAPLARNLADQLK
ncbi:uncharacterized protein [Miscanthus floridulus]|uniref:uncharacterized protein n=1 Tax=Miscanthus floridulus TaxID=154761 RepID=UPI003458A5C3